jgi:hypothetical protein
MKKFTYYLLIAVITICFITTANFAQTTVTKQLDYPTTVKTYQLQPNQDLVVMVNNVRKYDVLSVEPDNSDNKSIKLKAWEITYSIDAATTRSTSAIQSINSLSDANVSFNGGVLTINGSGGNKRSVIHLDIPSGLRTKILVNGVEYHNGTLSGSTMLQSGHLNNPNANSNPMIVNVRSSFNPNAAYTPEFSLISAISPKDASTSDLSGVFKRIDANTLSNLAIKKVPVPLSPDKGQSYALVNVEVNETGQVTSVSYAGGDTRLADFSSPTLKQFKFQPFISNGKAIKVASFVNVTSLDGKVTLFGKIK